MRQDEFIRSGGAFHFREETPRVSPGVLREIRRKLQDFFEKGDLNIYDPFCGNGSIPVIFSLYMRDAVARLYASDVDSDSVAMTTKNLERTSLDGLKAQLEEGGISFEGHERLGAKIEALRAYLVEKELKNPIRSQVFWSNIVTQRPGAMEDETLDLVCTDPPYDENCEWGQVGTLGAEESLRNALGNIRPKMKDDGRLCMLASSSSNLAADILSEHSGFRILSQTSPRMTMESGREILMAKAF